MIHMAEPHLAGDLDRSTDSLARKSMSSLATRYEGDSSMALTRAAASGSRAISRNGEDSGSRRS